MEDETLSPDARAEDPDPDDFFIHDVDQGRGYIIKIYFIIDQQIPRHFVHYSEYLSIPLPLYATHRVNPFHIQGS